jgi:hypothetical protein
MASNDKAIPQSVALQTHHKKAESRRVAKVYLSVSWHDVNVELLQSSALPRSGVPHVFMCDFLACPPPPLSTASSELKFGTLFVIVVSGLGWSCLCLPVV